MLFDCSRSHLLAALLFLLWMVPFGVGNPAYKGAQRTSVVGQENPEAEAQEDAEEVLSRSARHAYRLSNVYFPGKYEELKDSGKTVDCLPTLKPSIEMRTRLKNAVTLCVKKSLKRAMNFGRDMPCEAIKEVIASQMSPPIALRLENSPKVVKLPENKNSERSGRTKRSPHEIVPEDEAVKSVIASGGPAQKVDAGGGDISNKGNSFSSEEIDDQTDRLEDAPFLPLPPKPSLLDPGRLAEGQNKGFKENIDNDFSEIDFDTLDSRYEIHIEELEGFDELNFIAEMLSGAFGRENQNPYAMVLPVLGSKAMFLMDTHGTNKEGDDDDGKGEFGSRPWHLPTSSKKPVKDFITHMMLRKLNEFMQTCVVQQLQLVDDVGNFSPKHFMEFISLAFSDKDDEDLKALGKFVDVCASETKYFPEHLRPQAFSSSCFEPMISDFCLFRDHLMTDSGPDGENSIAVEVSDDSSESLFHQYVPNFDGSYMFNHATGSVESGKGFGKEDDQSMDGRKPVDPKSDVNKRTVSVGDGTAEGSLLTEVFDVFDDVEDDTPQTDVKVVSTTQRRQFENKRLYFPGETRSTEIENSSEISDYDGVSLTDSKETTEVPNWSESQGEDPQDLDDSFINSMEDGSNDEEKIEPGISENETNLLEEEEDSFELHGFGLKKSKTKGVLE